MAQRLAELGVLEALLDLGAVAVEVLDSASGLVGDVGEDEAVAVDVLELAVERRRAGWDGSSSAAWSRAASRSRRR